MLATAHNAIRRTLPAVLETTRAAGGDDRRRSRPAWRARAQPGREPVGAPPRCARREAADLLAPDRIRCRAPVTSKKRALELAARLFDDVVPPALRREIFAALNARERLGSTSLDSGVALPHARIPGLEAPVAACVTLARAVDFEAPDHRCVDVVFVVLLPDGYGGETIRALADTLSRAGVAAALRAQAAPAGVRSCLGGATPAPLPVDGDRARQPRGHCRLPTPCAAPGPGQRTCSAAGSTMQEASGARRDAPPAARPRAAPCPGDGTSRRGGPGAFDGAAAP